MLVVDLVGLRRMESPEWRLSGFGCSGALVVLGMQWSSSDIPSTPSLPESVLSAVSAGCRKV